MEVKAKWQIMAAVRKLCNCAIHERILRRIHYGSFLGAILGQKIVRESRRHDFKLTKSIYSVYVNHFTHYKHMHSTCHCTSELLI